METALEKWREPDHGSGSPRRPQALHLLEADVLGGGGSRRPLGGDRDELEFAARWQSAADEIKADICENAIDERGGFIQSYDSDALDASALLLLMVRFLPREDERLLKTRLAIADELSEDGLVLRYKVEETDDGLSGREGTFTICSFWLVSALVEIGEVARGRDLCERLLSHASPLGSTRRRSTRARAGISGTSRRPSPTSR